MQHSRTLPSSKQRPAGPQFDRVLGLIRFSSTVHIVEINFQELYRLLWIICETPIGDQLFSSENLSSWEEAMEETIRLLRELVVSVTELMHQCSDLYRRVYQVSGQFPEYERELKARFTENEVIQFVQGIGNYYLHNLRAAIGTTLTVVDLQNDMVEKKITLSKAALLSLGCSEVAMRFVDLAPQSIDLRQTLDAYYRSIRTFCDWFSQRTRVLSAIDYEAVNEYLGASGGTTSNS